MLSVAQKQSLLAVSEMFDDAASELTDFKFNAVIDHENITDATIVDLLQDKLYWISRKVEEVIHGLNSDNHEQAVQVATPSTTY